MVNVSPSQRAMLAQDPATPASVLLPFVAAGDRDMMMAMLRNGALPEVVITAIGRWVIAHSEEDVERVLHHSQVSREILEVAAKDGRWRRAVAHSSALPADMAAQLLSSGSVLVQGAVLCNMAAQLDEVTVAYVLGLDPAGSFGIYEAALVRVSGADARRVRDRQRLVDRLWEVVGWDAVSGWGDLSGLAQRVAVRVASLTRDAGQLSVLCGHPDVFVRLAAGSNPVASEADKVFLTLLG